MLYQLYIEPLTVNQFFYRGSPMGSGEEQGEEQGTGGLTLQQWLDATETSYSAFSRLLPCSVGYPRQLARGLARPSFEMALRIEQVTDGAVPRTLWFPPPIQQNEEPTPDIEELI